MTRERVTICVNYSCTIGVNYMFFKTDPEVFCETSGCKFRKLVQNDVT